MKHPFLAFLALVVAPAAVAMWGAERAAETAQAQLYRASATRAARLAAGTFEQDLAASVDVLVESAEPFEAADTAQEATRRALAGDTVTALDPTASGLELLVLFAEPEAPGTLRFNQGVLQTGAASLVGRITGARIAIFTEGRLWTASDPAPSVTALGPEALATAAAGAGASPLGAGVVLAVDPPRGAITVYAESPGASEAALSLPIRLVMGLLLFFAALAGWILLAGQDDRGASSSRAATVLLSLVPAVATLALLVHAVRDFDEASEALVARDLTRVLAVVQALDVSGSPEQIRRMSGFHAVLRASGRVSASTLEGVDAAIEALPAPPPSFTTSGFVRTPEGLSHYVGRRLGPGSSIVLLAPVPRAEREALTARTTLLGGGLWAWLLVVGIGLELRARRREREG